MATKKTKERMSLEATLVDAGFTPVQFEGDEAYALPPRFREPGFESEKARKPINAQHITTVVTSPEGLGNLLERFDYNPQIVERIGFSSRNAENYKGKEIQDPMQVDLYEISEME